MNHRSVVLRSSVHAHGLSFALALALSFAACSTSEPDGPLDFLVLPEQSQAAAQSLQSSLRQLSEREAPPTVQEFRAAVSGWRDAAGSDLDRGFRRAIARAGKDGASFVMRPVGGGQFPVRVSYLRNGSFFVAAEQGQSHILFRCRLSASEVVGAASVTSLQLRATLPGPFGETDVLLRLYVGSGFTVPQRLSTAESALLTACFEQLADRRNRAVRSFGADLQADVQATHDYFFEVER